MMSPKQSSSDDRVSRSSTVRQTPIQILHAFGNFMRIWSVYAMYEYVTSQGESVVVFIFSCLVVASVIFLVLQKPWKGRPLSNSQVVSVIINGGITASFFVLWGKALLSCGPLVVLLSEYAGVVLGVLSAFLSGRKVRIWRKIGGLFAMLIAFYFLSVGWANGTYSLFYSIQKEPSVHEKLILGPRRMLIPIACGILSALRRVIVRRVSLKNQLKRRLHTITIASATCFLFPVAIWNVISATSSDTIVKFHFATWPYLSTVLFGIVLIFYIENVAEEKLHLVFSSPKHLMVAGGSIICMEVFYEMNFSLTGFLICTSILGLGINEAMSLERPKGHPKFFQQFQDGEFPDQMQTSPLPT